MVVDGSLLSVLSIASMTSYISTRGKSGKNGFADTMLAGLAPDGGLFVPDEWPVFDDGELSALSGLSYDELAYRVISRFTGNDIDGDVLKSIIRDVYREGFEHSCVAPLVQIGENEWIMELFHGPTLAFKDYPLQLLGRLFDHVLEQRGQRLTIVGATSGDTGSAAIEACKSCRNIDIFILHPKGRTSEVQRRQMTSVIAPNVFNIALEGTFDDCQRLVKEMFADEVFRGDFNLSAINSINWARIMAQVVYYFFACLSLGGGVGRKVAFSVPTGNFGNVYAAWVAGRMGLPVERLVIGSNRNDILTRFFESGVMKVGEVEPSLSPSMDIQVSSNFERYLFEVTGRDSEIIAALMEEFRQSGCFSVSGELMEKVRKDFSANRCSDEQTRDMIALCYEQCGGYLIDPHTAVGLFCGLQERGSISPDVPLVSLACAHPAKFPDAVEEACGIRPELPSHLADLYDREERYTVIENDLAKVQDFIKSSLRG